MSEVHEESQRSRHSEWLSQTLQAQLDGDKVQLTVRGPMFHAWNKSSSRSLTPLSPTHRSMLNSSASSPHTARERWRRAVATMMDVLAGMYSGGELGNKAGRTLRRMLAEVRGVASSDVAYFKGTGGKRRSVSLIKARASTLASASHRIQ